MHAPSLFQNLTPTHNYSYDKIGNLVADKSEEIEEISWTMQGKVKEIRRTTGSQKPDLVFNYDGLGNRVSKTVIPKSSVNNEDSITTYYIRDAQGNILATYEKTKYKNGDEKFYLKEQYLYGSSRIGMNISNLLLASNVNGNVEIKEYDGYFTKTVGNKRYELTNHLGNVLAVVSDKKLPDNEPDVISVSDYYPFGMQMPGRLYSEPSNGYRFGYNTQEKTDEVAGTGNHYTAQYWEYNPQVVQRWNLDPKPNPSMSFYATFAGNPIINNDILGDTFDVANNSASKDDVKSLTKSENQKYISFTDGRVGLDFGNLDDKGISDLLNNDEGLNLINDMVLSDKKMLYEASDIALIRNEVGEKVTIYPNYLRNQLINASEGGLDSNKEHFYRPKKGYDGQVVFEPNVRFEEQDYEGVLILKSRASMVFHELAENYERTHNGINYSGSDGAHKRAINREKRWHGKSIRPGVANIIKASRPNRKRTIELIEIQKTYMGW